MITFNTVLNSLLPKAHSIAPLVIAGIGSAIGGGLSYLGSKKAGDAQATAAKDATASTERLSNMARDDMSPFLDAAIGTPAYDKLRVWGSTSYQPRIDPATGEQVREGGALDEYRAGIDTAPQAPRLSMYRARGDFTPEFAESGQRFAGDRFSYDPNEAMNSPDIQFLREQGEQGLKRSLAGNRKLGSGNRLLDFMKFNQGLASTGLNDYYNRQFQQSRENYGRDLGEDELGYNRGLIERGISAEDYDRNLAQERQNVTDYNQWKLQRHQLESGDHDTRMSRLGDLINVGSGAGRVTSEGALQTGRNLADISGSLGASQAASTLGRFNAIGQGLGDAGYLYGLSRQPGYASNYSPYSGSSGSGVDIGFNPSSKGFF